MKRMSVVSILSIAGALAVAGCSDSGSGLTGAESAPPTFAASATGSAAGQYVVSLKGNPSQFSAAVEAMGGSVLFLHEPTKFALVAGLSADQATGLTSRADVAAVAADVAIAMNVPQHVIDETATVGPGITSVANPAAAIRYSWQWNMRAIGADAAWAAGKLGSPSVTVAILDTGIDYTSLDANGLVDLSRSTSFVASDNAMRDAHFPTRHISDDFNGHGTNVASQVSSTAVAHAGVTSRTTLISVKVLGASGSGSSGGVLAGILYAADAGADVINMSLGGAFLKSGGNGQLVSLIGQVMNYAHRRGTLVVVSAGNDLIDLDHDLIPDEDTGEIGHFPSLYSTYCDAPTVVCVSAVGPLTFTTTADIPAVYTNFGRSAISVAGPGGNIATTPSVWPWGVHIGSFVWSMCPINLLNNPASPTPNTPANRPCRSGGSVNGYIGTSQASPHVAGLAALLIAESGKSNPSRIKAMIQQSADDLGPSGTDPYFGKGRINVRTALGL